MAPTAGSTLPIAVEGGNGVWRKVDDVETSIYSRALAESVEKQPDATAGTLLGDVLIDGLVEAGVHEVKVRSVLTCEARRESAQPATAVRSLPASSSTSARPSASSPRSPSVSQAPS